jgi:hypothetical protein
MEGGEPAQKLQMRLAPIDDIVVIAAASDRAAHHRQQHFAQRIHHLARLPPIGDRGKMIEQQTQAWRRRQRFHRTLPNHPIQENHFQPAAESPPLTRQSKNRVNLNTEPWIGVVVAGVLGWIALSIGGQYASIRCAFERWYSNGICAVADESDESG